jgi:hypothetical protein
MLFVVNKKDDLAPMEDLQDHKVAQLSNLGCRMLCRQCPVLVRVCKCSSKTAMSIVCL